MPFVYSTKFTQLFRWESDVPFSFTPYWLSGTSGSHLTQCTNSLTPILSFELVVWLVPSLIGGGIAVSIVGVVLGPFYPIAMNQAVRVIPQPLLTGSIGWIAGLGQAGSALLPFITGALASRFGIQSLQPLYVYCKSLARLGLIIDAIEIAW
jgi:fucose permease